MTVHRDIGPMVHVAAESENRGRVVLHVRSGRPNLLAIDTAIRIARAYHARLESLFVEEPQLLDGAAHAFINEISLTGHTIRSLEVAAIEDSFVFNARCAHGMISERAKAATVPLQMRIVRDETLRALSLACTESGPWNMIVLAEPFSLSDRNLLAHLLSEIAGATALVAVGPRATRANGPILLAIESADRLDGMLRLAERLTADEDAAHRTRVILLPVAETIDASHELDAQLRLALAGDDRIAMLDCLATHGAPEVVAEVLRRSAPGLIVAQVGGAVLAEGGELRDLAHCLECPIILIR